MLMNSDLNSDVWKRVHQQEDVREVLTQLKADN